MRFSLLSMTMLSGCVIAACGDDGGSPMPDAPTGLTLGKGCNAPTDCPTSAPVCTGPNGWCTPACVTNGTATGGSGGLMMVMPSPSTGTAICTSAYHEAIGVPECNVVISYSPMDMPTVTSKAYTEVTYGCAVQCSSDMCPQGMHPYLMGGPCLCLPD